MARTFKKTATSDNRDSPKPDDKLIDELAGLEPLAYEQRLVAVTKELGIHVGRLDRLVKAKRRAIRKAKAASAAMPNLVDTATPAHHEMARVLMCQPDILSEFGRAVENSGLIG